MFQQSLLPGLYHQMRAPPFFSYFSLLLLLASLRLGLDMVSGQSYNIFIDPYFSPPGSIPSDPKKMIYSAPLNQLTSRRTVAYLTDSTGKIQTDKVGDVYVTSMDKSEKSGNGTDKWRTSGGILCHHTIPNADFPVRLNRELFYTTCGSRVSNTTLMAKLLKGKIIIDWIIHKHPTGEIPANVRFLRIKIPKFKISNDTNYFKITEPAADLVITKQPPKNITANTKFNIAAEIQDKTGARLTEGLDSVAYVELTVSYQHKVFYHKHGKDMLLKSSRIRLSGPLVTTYKSTKDLVIRQRAVAGKVAFTDVRILDTVYNLQLNLTMFTSKDPYARIPNCEKCYSDLGYKSVSKEGLVYFKMPPPGVLKEIPSLTFTQPFDVIPQAYANLKLIHHYKGRGSMKVTRNFPIPGPLTLELQDANKNRIHSGPDSNMPLEVETVPPDLCLTTDYSADSVEGIATFTGSICENVDSAYLLFYSKKMPSLNATSQELKVIGDVHIVHFDHFDFTGAGREISPHINSFVRFAASDVNKGIIPGVLRPFNMKLIIDTVETRNDIANTILQYRLIKEDAAKNPSSIVRTAILSGNSEIGAAMARELFHEEITQISLDEKGDKYTDFPYFNRVCFNSRQIYKSFLQYCHARHWMRMVVLRTEDTVISRSLESFARYMRMELEEVVIEVKNIQWKDKNPDSHGVLKTVFKKVKQMKTKIITCFASHIQMPAILHIAKKQGLSAEEGYQWVFVSKFAWAFPFNNSFSCDVIPECTTVYGGAILFTETYNTSYMHTKDWERVLDHYYSVDKSIYVGLIPVYPNSDKAARMALGYDAIWLYAEALTKIASRRLTATTSRVMKELRRVTIQGLSGTVRLDSKGDRKGFQANVRIISATKPKQPMEKVAPLYKYLLATPGKGNIEYVYEDGKNTPFTNESVLEIRLPKSNIFNVHSFQSRSGRLSKTNLRLEKYSNESWPQTFITRKENAVPPFTCNLQCGTLLSSENINEFDRGMCVSMDTCECHPGYLGDHCERILCKCSHGHCTVPSKCTCDVGYTGVRCDIPICCDGCENGKCIGPERCQCSSSYWVGAHCHVHLAAILVPLFILLVLFIYLIYKFIIFLRKHIERATALSNLDWLVDWQEVIQPQDTATSNRSKTFASSTNSTMNTCYMWRKRKWFVKYINSNTVDQSDINMHLEMVELITINHQNLITYGGACLVSPNVSFLSELAQKGSLEDILQNETMQLDWNFSFSFMKDICRGMNYLHTKTKIGSHGRLKSSNCLLDNRWCIRITDFGAPSIRYGNYLVEKTEEEKSKEYFATQESLLWTAPELLGDITCLDDVKMGTKEGDVYSFAIVISEIVTRDAPFAYERSYLSTCALIDLIVNKDDPMVTNELEIWNSLDNEGDMIRPKICRDLFPPGQQERDKFMKMLNEMWDNDPFARVTFLKLTSVLDHLCPSKDELMDNLMHLLESYSKNLEQIVIDRTDALESEKAKVESIVSQMLPRKVIEEIKLGQKIEPENFECVTVYYSDIVGFTSIAKSIQPMQVVDLLNELYNLFDGILSQYDVYKVETIGDAYVVASGVPTPNGKLHAGEIATASLDVMSAIMTMKMSILTHVKLQMRLGISTGPVVAGVVGLKMPRYTLFGDTMQIASTMESTSKPMHIQMSEYTVKILTELGGYSMKYRANMSVCGRNIDTYWLTGKRGYNKPLPEIKDDEE